MNINQTKPNDTSLSQDFIPAQESVWFIKFFDLYNRNLFWRRFQNVWMQSEYLPRTGDRTIYYLNHTSWWDGLIPLLLNQKVFRQKARAMMEGKQMQRHRFFKKIGAFSVNSDDKRSSVRSLRYAINSMKRENACLFIYPEGRIVPFTTEKPEFKDGLSWIISKLEGIKVVPVGIYISYNRSDKPELFIKTGKSVKFEKDITQSESNNLLENSLQKVLIRLVNDAHSDERPFKLL